MTDLDLDALEQKARAATRGRWKACGAPNCTCGLVWVDEDRAVALSGHRETGGDPVRRADMAYVAAACPDVVLALVARLRAAEGVPCSTCNGSGGSKGGHMNCPDCHGSGRGTWREWKCRAEDLEKELDAAESRATRAEAQRDRLAGALRRICVECTDGDDARDTVLFCEEKARAVLAEVDDGVVGGGG